MSIIELDQVDMPLAGRETARRIDIDDLIAPPVQDEGGHAHIGKTGRAVRLQVGDKAPIDLRRLADEGHTFSGVVDGVRDDLVGRYLGARATARARPLSELTPRLQGLMGALADAAGSSAAGPASG